MTVKSRQRGDALTSFLLALVHVWQADGGHTATMNGAEQARRMPLRACARGRGKKCLSLLNKQGGERGGRLMRRDFSARIARARET